MQAKVADFGSVGRLAATKPHSWREPTSALPTSATSDDTADLTLGVGTPLYMSLEMLQHGAYDASTDVWSFGCVLWEMAAEAPPDLVVQEGYGLTGPIYSLLIRALEAGKRLTVQPTWPAEWRVLLPHTWRATPAERPTFAEVLRSLSGRLAGDGVAGECGSAS